MANSVDPDQTAPSGAVWSVSALFAHAISLETLVYKILGHYCNCLQGGSTLRRKLTAASNSENLPGAKSLSDAFLTEKLILFLYEKIY